MTSFKEEIRHCFPYLFEKWGFQFIDVKDDYDGNIAIAQSDNLRIRFIQDRVDFFLDIGNTQGPERWVSFYKILDQLRASGLVTDEYKYSNKMKMISNLLKQYFPVIKKG